jgi:hypothetical protein
LLGVSVGTNIISLDFSIQAHFEKHLLDFNTSLFVLQIDLDVDGFIMLALLFNLVFNCNGHMLLIYLRVIALFKRNLQILIPIQVYVLYFSFKDQVGGLLPLLLYDKCVLVIILNVVQVLKLLGREQVIISLECANFSLKVNHTHQQHFFARIHVLLKRLLISGCRLLICRLLMNSV